MTRKILFCLMFCLIVGVTPGAGQGAESISMKQVLLNPRGFNMEWSCGNKSGHSRVFFLEESGNIVTEIRVLDIENVDVNNPINFGEESCNSYAKLTDKGIIFYGCRSTAWDIPLTYYPGDEKTPFKGSGTDCNKIALSPW